MIVIPERVLVALAFSEQRRNFAADCVGEWQACERDGKRDRRSGESVRHTHLMTASASRESVSIVSSAVDWLRQHMI